MRRIYSREKEYDWLPILLDAYSIKDKGIKKEIKEAESNRGRKVACHKGCSACCKNPSIPISEIELRGIAWYATEEIDEDIQNKIVEQIGNGSEWLACPFLVNNQCSIYNARPLACRMFYVFNKVCEEFEDVQDTRPHDIHRTSRELAYEVSMRILDYKGYNLHSKNEKEEAFEEGVILETSKQFHEIDLSFIAKAILENRNKGSKS